MYKIKYILKLILISAIFLIADICVSQELSFEKVLSAFDEGDFNNVKINLQSIDTSKISKYDKATWLYYFADYQFRIDKHDKAYQSIIASKKIFASLNEIADVIDCNLLSLSIISHQNDLYIDTQKIIAEVEQYALKSNDSTALRKVYHKIASTYLDEKSLNQYEAIKYFRKIIPIAITQKDSVRVGYSYLNVGTAFQNAPPQHLDSAIYYTRKAIGVFIKHKDFQTLAYAYNNYAEQKKILREYDSAIYYFKKADLIPLTQNIVKSKLIFYDNIADIYNKLSDFKNEVLYLKKIAHLKDSINDTKQNIAISDIKEKYDNEKLRADNLEITSENKQKQNLLIGSFIFILLIGTIAILLLINSKRKQKLAEQQKEIQTQKNLTLLKEQEITTINAMVEGQEKERKRVAEDLHDNLGSVLATLKLHFENLKINQEKKKINQEELFNKTENLIDEAYLKVRRIAHAKNAGVIANQGLLVAIKMMAEKISSADKIKIDVIDFGLDKPLENSLEISVFRIVQELITNVLKHAEAKNATIHISLYDKNLNIIIEDDGKGFAIKNINLKNGMGLNSIKTRVAHLNGTFDIDSTIGKGTSILINIPIP